MTTDRVTVERPDDETIEIHVDGEVVASANHDEHGWSGMDAVEATALAVSRALAATPAAEHPLTTAQVLSRFHDELIAEGFQSRDVVTVILTAALPAFIARDGLIIKTTQDSPTEEAQPADA